MTLRQACGFVLGMVGVWLMWQTGLGIAAYLSAADGAKSLTDVKRGKPKPRLTSAAIMRQRESFIREGRKMQARKWR